MSDNDVEEFHEESFSFRILNFPIEKADLLRGSVRDAEVQIRTTGDRVVALFDLLPSHDYSWLPDLMHRLDLKPENCSVWVSLVTSNDHDGLSIPAGVLDVLRRTKVGLDFSFVVA